MDVGKNLIKDKVLIIPLGLKKVVLISLRVFSLKKVHSRNFCSTF